MRDGFKTERDSALTMLQRFHSAERIGRRRQRH